MNNVQLISLKFKAVGLVYKCLNCFLIECHWYMRCIFIVLLKGICILVLDKIILQNKANYLSESEKILTSQCKENPILSFFVTVVMLYSHFKQFLQTFITLLLLIQINQLWIHRAMMLIHQDEAGWIWYFWKGWSAIQLPEILSQGLCSSWAPYDNKCSSVWYCSVALLVQPWC